MTTTNHPIGATLPSNDSTCWPILGWIDPANLSSRAACSRLYGREWIMEPDYNKSKDCTNYVPVGLINVPVQGKNTVCRKISHSGGIASCCTNLSPNGMLNSTISCDPKYTIGSQNCAETLINYCNNLSPAALLTDPVALKWKNSGKLAEYEAIMLSKINSDPSTLKLKEYRAIAMKNPTKCDSSAAQYCKSFAGSLTPNGPDGFCSCYNAPPLKGNELAPAACYNGNCINYGYKSVGNYNISTNCPSVIDCSQYLSISDAVNSGFDRIKLTQTCQNLPETTKTSSANANAANTDAANAANANAANANSIGVAPPVIGAVAAGGISFILFIFIVIIAMVVFGIFMYKKYKGRSDKPSSP